MFWLDSEMPCSEQLLLCRLIGEALMKVWVESQAANWFESPRKLAGDP